MITGFLLHIIANAVAILASAWLIPNVVFKYEFLSLMKIALMLAVVNVLLKPIIKLITGPLILLTLGLFTLIINIFLIWLVTRLSPELSINGLPAYFWTMIIVSFLNLIVSAATHGKEKLNV